MIASSAALALEVFPPAAPFMLVSFGFLQFVQVVSVAFRHAVRRSAFLIFATFSSAVAHALETSIVEFLAARLIAAARMLGLVRTTLACALLSGSPFLLPCLRSVRLSVAGCSRLRARLTPFAARGTQPLQASS